MKSYTLTIVGLRTRRKLTYADVGHSDDFDLSDFVETDDDMISQDYERHLSHEHEPYDPNKDIVNPNDLNNTRGQQNPSSLYNPRLCD